MKESSKVHFLLQTGVGLAHVMKLHHPTRQVHAHPFVPVQPNNNTTQTHFNSPKRVHDSAVKNNFFIFYNYNFEVEGVREERQKKGERL